MLRKGHLNQQWRPVVAGNAPSLNILDKLPLTKLRIKRFSVQHTFELQYDVPTWVYLLL